MRLKAVLAVISGIVSAGIVIGLVETVSHTFLSPQNAFLGAILGYCLGAAVGSSVVVNWADKKLALIVPCVLCALAGINFFSFPHPIWFAPAAILALVLGWQFGARFVSQRS